MISAAPRPLLRLIAIAVVLAGAAGWSGRAPQALRAGTDVAAELMHRRPQPAGVRLVRAHPTYRPLVPPHVAHGTGAGGHPVRLPAAQRPSAGDWPCCPGGQSVLLRKRTRLI